MNQCDQFQAVLLDYLYGLLEPDEGHELERHLADCGGCRAALAGAERQQQLLAAASKLEFAGVRFQPPATLPLTPRPADGRSAWRRWAAVAAGLLLLTGGLTVPAGLSLHQRQEMLQAEADLRRLKDQAKALDDEYLKQVVQADREYKDVADRLSRLPQERKDELAKLEQEGKSPKHLRLTVAGPKSPEAGAPNRYRIMTPAGKDQQLSVRILDEQRQVVYREDNIRTRGEHRFILPPSLPLRPAAALTLEVAARGPDGAEETARETLRLVAPQYLTHLATDKPLYQPGETVRFRALALKRFSLRPAREDLQLTFKVLKPSGPAVELTGLSRVVNERGEPILGPDGQPIRGIGAGEYRIGPDEPAGEYALEVSEGQGRFPPQRRKFLVSKYQRPRLNKTVEFTRRSYGSGETVRATCKAARVADGNKPTAGVKVEAVITVDGQPPTRLLPVPTDAAGAAELHFRLPSRIERGIASLSVTFTDGKTVETVVRPVPIVLKKIQVEFFPEGGDLIAGVPNRVYFHAQTMLGKPAELKGRLVDEQGQVVAAVHTFSDPAKPAANQGMGRFEFTPQANKQYRLKLDAPADIEQIVSPLGRDGSRLTAARADGVALTVPTGVTTDKDPIRVVIHNAGKDRKLLVGVYCRGRLLAQERLQAKAGQPAVAELTPESKAGGVYRVTVFEENGPKLTPKAERLIYRAPAERLNLAVKPDRQHYAPGERVRLAVEATDEKQAPAPAILMVAVTDQSILQLAGDKTLRRMPTHFLLTSEVRRPEDLEDADFLLGDAGPAAVALDLLLGTQGWRRFAEQSPADFQRRHWQEPDEALVFHSQAQEQLINVDGQKIEKLNESYRARAFELTAGLTEADARRLAARTDNRFPEARQCLAAAAEVLQQHYDRAASRLTAFHEYGMTLRRLLLPLLVIVLLGGVLIGLARRVSLAQALSYAAASACSVGLVGFIVSVQIGGNDVPDPAFALAPAIWDKLPPPERPTPIDLRAFARDVAPQPRPPFRNSMPIRPATTVQGTHVSSTALAGDRLTPRHPLIQAPSGTAKSYKNGFFSIQSLNNSRPFAPAAPPFVVREYAHRHPAGAAQDFTETLLWQPVVVLPDGKAELSFDLSDAVTSYRVLAAGHTADGRLGAVTATVQTRKEAPAK